MRRPCGYHRGCVNANESPALDEGLNVHKKDSHYKWHYIILVGEGGGEASCRDIWGLNPEWLDHVGQRILASGSVGLT